MRTNAAVKVDLKCIECKYNLRGLSTDGRCPECGRSIADSLAIRKPTSKFFFTKWGIIVLAALHLLFATLLIVGGGPSGGLGAFFALALIDFPLSYVLGWILGPKPISTINGWYLAYFAVAGTIMYGLCGALLGLIIDWIRRSMRTAQQS